MLSQSQLDRYADILLWGLEISRNGKTQKKDIVLVRYHLPAIQLAEVLQAKLLQQHKHPVLRMVPTPTMEKQHYRLADDAQLAFIAPGEEVLAKNLSGNIFLYAPESLTHLRRIDPEKIGKTALRQKKIKDILNRRDEKGLFSWTLCMVPTPALAEQANLSMTEYNKQIVTACFLNRKDPVAHWKEIYRQIASIKKWLNSLPMEEIHVASDHTDLIITPGKDRKWLGLSGHNIPSFEIFLSPDWRGTKGVYYADQPSFRSGNYVQGIRIEFQKGKAVQIRAEKGEAFARKQCTMDAGASRIGEFSLTDKRFSKINRFMANTLFDENYGGRYGNCHIALGSSYSNSYRGNPASLKNSVKKQMGFNDSALHWDIVNTEKKRVTAKLSSGKKVVIYENGQFAR